MPLLAPPEASMTRNLIISRPQLLPSFNKSSKSDTIHDDIDTTFALLDFPTFPHRFSYWKGADFLVLMSDFDTAMMVW